MYIVGEIGINANGSLENALSLIRMAARCGCNAVKFQKRDPEISVPEHQRQVMRETPWGIIPYIEYKKKLEFGYDEFCEIDATAKEHGIDWFASVWDTYGVDFMRQFNPPYLKIPSATATDSRVLWYAARTGIPLIISTGGMNGSQVQRMVNVVESSRGNIAWLMHCVMKYPAESTELNLMCIRGLRESFRGLYRVGYSGHEVGITPSVVAAALGATCIERHITLSRRMWGTDQAVSLEEDGLKRLVRDCHDVDNWLGDGIKQLESYEIPTVKKLRMTTDL